jgi:hypothetical protein
MQDIPLNQPTPQRLHPALLAGLAATLLATAWALWWPDDAASDRGALPSRAPAPRDEASVAKGLSTTATASAEAKEEDAPLLTAAARDPFFPAPPPAPATAAKATPEPARAEPTPPTPPPPPPPPMNHRVVGRFLSPEGQWLVFVQDGTQAVQATAGLTLSSGWVVESITARELRLRHPQAEQAASLPLPEDNSP